MASGELELIIARNSDFLSVRRTRSGAGLYHSVTGEYYGGIGNGWLPEYSRHLGPNNTYLVRGWRNILYEFLVKHRVRPTKEVRRLLGDSEARAAYDYGMVAAPMSDPAPAWNHSGLHS